MFFLLSIWILFFKYFCNFGWIFIKCASVTYAPVVIILNLSLHVLNNNIFFVPRFTLLFQTLLKTKGKICGASNVATEFALPYNLWPTHIRKQHTKKNKTNIYSYYDTFLSDETLWTISKIPNIIKVCVFDWMLLFLNRTKSARTYTQSFWIMHIPTLFDIESPFFRLNVFRRIFIESFSRSTFGRNICYWFLI